MISSSTGLAVLLTEPAGFSEDFVLPSSSPRAGVVLEDIMTPYSFGGGGETLTGRIQNRVVRYDDDGTLGFHWGIRADDYDRETNNGDLFGFRVTGFAGYTLDADYSPTSIGTVAPDIARYFGIDAGSVNWLFQTDLVGAGEWSRFFRLDTQATDYAMTGLYDLLGDNVASISGIFPTFAPIPEPATLGLLGLVSAGIWFKRRFFIA